MKIQKNKNSYSIHNFLQKELFYIEDYGGYEKEKCIEDKTSSLLNFQSKLIEKLLEKNILSFDDLLDVADVFYKDGYSLEKDL